MPFAPPPGSSPLAPPPGDSPFAPPPAQTPSPLDDAPPAMPREREPSGVPRTTPRPPADTKPPTDTKVPGDLAPPTDLTPPTDANLGTAPDIRPSEELPEPPGMGVPPLGDGDAPPKMPDDDPFKDDPESPLGPPSPAAPKPGESGADAPPRPFRQAARWRTPGSTPERVQATNASVGFQREEPRRLEFADEDGGAAPLPSRVARANPLRSIGQAEPPEMVVPAASYPVMGAATSVGDEGTWRHNPLRSN
jgi:hypothetical protein